ncbi:MAG: DoxX family membrane protein [Bacteroidia bacterium]|nr:DoxX family membrane protein [Bacteroidia bacterium]
MHAKRDVFLGLSRILVGVLFTISGLIKINDVRGFAYKLDEYFEVFQKHTDLPFHELLSPWSVGLAGVIAVAETALALFLLIGYARHLTTWSLVSMILFFTFLTAYSAITKAVSDCGCFGEVIKLTPWQSFAKDVVLLFFIGYLFLKREEIAPWIPRKWLLPVAWGMTGVFAGMTYYFYSYLPAIDFLPYHTGKNLKEALSPGSRGVPEITDYVSTKLTDCQIDELTGKVLIIVALRLEALREPEIAQLRQLIEGLPSDVRVVGVTASPRDVRTEWPRSKGLPICFAPQDQTVLKAMLRASSGALYLEEGVIRAKWPWRRLPKGSELTSWASSS